MKAIITCIILGVSIHIYAQIPMNISLSNPEAEQVLLGNYDPDLYTPSSSPGSIDRFVCDVRDRVSPDSIKALLIDLESFHNRNTYSDTSSADSGIGAARRWALQKFEQYRAENENRLIPSYMDFELNALGACGAGNFRNVLAVLPGLDTTDPSIIIIEAHMDSRCELVCDVTCLANGTDDNSSGTALVMDLARVMSGKAYDHTLVFMLTVGEEQGLYGAEAFARYASNNDISIKAVQNNDVVGGIICGATSSPPSCPFENHIDSNQLRIFSFGNNGSPHKMFARSVKMMYEEKLKPISDVPMNISLMIPEDRTGRGGDHIPFREQGYTALRFTAANEHGNANTSAPGYSDRQHTSRDILGVDTDGNGSIDSFFVDINYLKRNTQINGIIATMLALGPETPLFTSTATPSGVLVEVLDTNDYDHYRIGVRDGTNNPDFIAVYTIRDTNRFTVPNLLDGNVYRISLAAVDSNGIMGMFTQETNVVSQSNTFGISYDTVAYNNCECIATGEYELPDAALLTEGVQILQNKPNPFTRETIIPINFSGSGKLAGSLVVTDLLGNSIRQMAITLRPGKNSVRLDLTDVSPGIYMYGFYNAGKLYGTKKLVLN